MNQPSTSFWQRWRWTLLTLAAAILLPFAVGMLEGQSPAAVLSNNAGVSKFVQGLAIEVFIFALYALSYDLIFGITVNGLSSIDVPAGVTLTQTAQGITGKVDAPGILKKSGDGTLTFAGTSDNPTLSLEVAGGGVNHPERECTESFASFLLAASCCPSKPQLPLRHSHSRKGSSRFRAS